jgi:phosphoglycolate phosphatase-like HAD superfamily hydrolase
MILDKYKAFIFDFDGVILDSVGIKTDAFVEMYAEYGESVQEKVKQHHLSNGGISRFEKFRLYHKDYCGISLNEVEILELADRFSRLVLENVLKAPFLHNSLEFLIKNHKKEIPQFIVTGTPQNEIEAICQERNLSKYFEGIYGSPESKTVLLDRLKLQHGFSSEELCFFGDSINDYEAAKNHKIDFFACNNVSLKPISKFYFINFKEIL